MADPSGLRVVTVPEEQLPLRYTLFMLTQEAEKRETADRIRQKLYLRNEKLTGQLMAKLDEPDLTAEDVAVLADSVTNLSQETARLFGLYAPEDGCEDEPEGHALTTLLARVDAKAVSPR